MQFKKLVWSIPSHNIQIIKTIKYNKLIFIPRYTRIYCFYSNESFNLGPPPWFFL